MSCTKPILVLVPTEATFRRGKVSFCFPIGITPSIVFGRSKTSRRSVNSTVVLRKKYGSEKMN